MEKHERLAKGVTAHYTSIEELAAAYGKSTIKQTKDKQKLESQRAKFLGTCRSCGQPLNYVEGTNIIVCKNKSCKGLVDRVEKNDLGEDVASYKPVVRILTGVQSVIAENLFA